MQLAANGGRVAPPLASLRFWLGRLAEGRVTGEGGSEGVVSVCVKYMSMRRVRTSCYVQVLVWEAAIAAPTPRLFQCAVVRSKVCDVNAQESARERDPRFRSGSDIEEDPRESQG